MTVRFTIDQPGIGKGRSGSGPKTTRQRRKAQRPECKRCGARHTPAAKRYRGLCRDCTKCGKP